MSRLLFFSLLLSTAAVADRGAFTLDVGVGGVATTVPALQSAVPTSTLSFDVSTWLGFRYALTNNFELSATGFFDPPATIFQNDVQLVTESGTYPGTTRHQYLRGGAQAGLRLVLGMRFRLHLGLELGWCQQAYSSIKHFDVSGADGAVDYGLTIPDVSKANFVVAPMLGLEWVSPGSWSIALMPRAQVMLGNGLSWAVIVPLQFSWSWYL